MNKQAPTFGRLAIMVGFALSCFGLLLFLWLAFGGPVPLKPQGYRFTTSFAEGTQLAVEADVRISGVPVGKVKTITPSGRTGRSVAVIELEERFAPLPRDSKAILRQKTLLGETYVELTPGTKRPDNMLPENGDLAISQVSTTVELDEIFRAFDPETRRSFQTWMQTQAQAVRGRSTDINDILGNLDPFAQDTTDLLRVLDTQEGAVSQVISNTGQVFDALSERRGQLQGLITNSRRVFETTSLRDDDLQDLFRVLPAFNTEAGATVRRLEAFARDTDPLVTQLRPAARELSPTFAQLRLLAPDLRALFRDIDPLITASEAGLPALRDFLEDLRPALGEFDPTLKQLNPILSYLGEYKQELGNFFSGPPSATQSIGPDQVHYLRTLNPNNPENFAAFPRRVGSNRTNPYQKPFGFDRQTSNTLQSFDTRHCNRPTPRVPDATTLAGQLLTSVPSIQAIAANPVGALTGATQTPQQLAQQEAEELATSIIEFGFGGVGQEVPAPPCLLQEPFTVNEGEFGAGGATTQYPQIREARTSTRTPGR